MDRFQLPDDLPDLVADCPTCDGDTYNFAPHGCDEDCRRHCNKLTPRPCDKCKAIKEEQEA